jgi:hypothetical protein
MLFLGYSLHTSTYLPMKMEQTECSEMLALKIHMPVNTPEESIQQSEHCESLKSRKIMPSFQELLDPSMYIKDQLSSVKHFHSGSLPSTTAQPRLHSRCLLKTRTYPRPNTILLL